MLKKETNATPDISVKDVTKFCQWTKYWAAEKSSVVHALQETVRSADTCREIHSKPMHWKYWNNTKNHGYQTATKKSTEK